MKGLEALLDSKAPHALVDARTDKYFDGALIIGAERLPYDSDQTMIEKVLPNKKKLIIVYCGGGECPASKNLAKRLIELGYTNVIDYHGGMQEWESHNKPTQHINS
ncbi:MAG: hypothetical protein BGO67_05020 [Alphaproteobacteria bacterium 41-28]|nr:MAG: hypothetical protein BGO67_05020 [Alphaproteobacteria bacterium 41-28]